MPLSSFGIVGLVLVLGFAPARGYASVAAAPAAVGQPAAAPAAKTPPCGQATLAQLLPLFPQRARGSIVPKTEVAPGSAESVLIYLHPGPAPDRLEFHAFVAPIRASGSGPDAAHATPLTILRVNHPPDVSDAADGKPLSDNQGAYGVHVVLPDTPSWSPRQHRVLIVVACAAAGGVGAQGGAEDVAGYAQRPVWLSTKGGSALIAGGLMLAIYAMAAILVWAKRNQEAMRSDALKDTPLRRVKRIEPWPLRRCLDPVVMSADMFDRASLSKLQILFFVVIIGFGATYSLVRTGTLSDLSSSIVLLLGLPALGTLGTQAASATRDRFSLDNWAWLVARHVLPVNDPGADTPRWLDLVMSDAELDLYKLQAFLFSVIVGGAMIVSGFTNLATFTVPDTLLEILGLSQVVFVGGRFTKPATIGDIDDLVTELRQRGSALMLAAQTGTDVDDKGQPVVRSARSRTPRADTAAPVASLKAARALVPNAAARYEDLAERVILLLDNLTHRDVRTDLLKDPFFRPAHADGRLEPASQPRRLPAVVRSPAH